MNDTETLEVVGAPITVQQVKDLLCCAIEGGSNYWCDSITSMGGITKAQAEYRQDVPFVEGGWLEVIEDKNEGEGRVFRLDLAALKKGLHVFAQKCPRAFADLINDNMDAGTGDEYLQCCCFGESIYG